MSVYPRSNHIPRGHQCFCHQDPARAGLGAVQRGGVLKSLTHWIRKDTSTPLRKRARRLFRKQSNQGKSIENDSVASLCKIHNNAHLL